MGSVPSGHLGSVLVVGGCGFVGFHIVRHFLLESGCTSVAVLSRNPQSNHIPEVSYHAGDISDLASLRALIFHIRPSVIVHSASPSTVSASTKEFKAITIGGTRNLLTVASEVSSVKVFIFTSSATMAAGPEHVDPDESTRLADTVSSSHPYAKTKATADKMVLAANLPLGKHGSGSSLLTACIRLPIVYGERDLIAISGALAALEKGQTHFQLGDGSNLWDFVSADNVATAHVLLAKALLSQTDADATPKVAGEAFNITDGERRLFWDYPRVIWNAAGHEVKADQLWILPTWVALILADVFEWLFWFFTFGTKRPSLLGRQQAEYSCLTHTYRIDKAKKSLGYVPVPDFENGLRKAVGRSLTEGGWGSRLKKYN